jgi:hypothetical protein
MQKEWLRYGRQSLHYIRIPVHVDEGGMGIVEKRVDRTLQDGQKQCACRRSVCITAYAHKGLERTQLSVWSMSMINTQHRSLRTYD